MNTVDILEHEELPEENLEGLKLFMQCCDISEGAGGSSAASTQVMGGSGDVVCAAGLSECYLPSEGHLIFSKCFTGFC